EPALKKVIGPWHVDEVPVGQPSPHLYWVKEDGTRIVVDRQVRSVVNGGCLLYETTRGSAASVVYGVVVGKNPLAVATSDAFRPWHIRFDGLRRFDPPHTDEQGTLRLDMDYIASADICQLAYIQPAFTESWVSAPLTAAPVKTEHTSLAVHG